MKRIFKWAVSEELIQPEVYQKLATVDAPRKGKAAAKECPPVLPVADAMVEATLPHLRPVVNVRELDPKTLRRERTEDEIKQLEVAARISPITHVSSDDPPMLIIHRDADKLAPIQQAEIIVDKFKQAGVQAELITRPKRGHDLNGIEKDLADMTDWFDKHLKK